MRYLQASLACLGLLAAYGLLMQALGLKHAGAIPLLLLFGAMIFVWRSLTKNKKPAE